MNILEQQNKRLRCKKNIAPKDRDVYVLTQILWTLLFAPMIHSMLVEL